MSFENILTETRGDGERKTGLITLNRPKQLNALNDALMDELGAALKAFDADPGIGCIVITGSEKAFAAGADISAMAKFGFNDSYGGDFITRNWETIRSIRKPVIAAIKLEEVLNPLFPAIFHEASLVATALSPAFRDLPSLAARCGRQTGARVVRLDPWRRRQALQDAQRGHGETRRSARRGRGARLPNCIRKKRCVERRGTARDR